MIYPIIKKYLSFTRLIILAAGFYSCHPPEESGGVIEKSLFRLIDNKSSGIDFVNQVDYTEEYNTYTYRNFYNGAGVGLGDINNDGLIDIYFAGNLADNRLYLNKGNFQFEDITEKAGVACKGVWSTGISMVDINADGWLDIYVCKSGLLNMPHRNNELFINNGNKTFTERSKEFGLDNVGLSTQAAFFDYDKDGDLDVYLLNNAPRSVSGYYKTMSQRKIRDQEGGNKFLRNDGMHFTDISEKAGIYGSMIGFGLGVTVGDIDRDGWPDIYVSNDFFEKDYLYINNRNGTFTEKLEDEMREISMGSMGADMADINNDGYPEIFVTEMTPEPEERYKTKAMFESWENYQRSQDSGYYHQFARNVLQLNRGNGSFSEIGRYAGISTTDWSWGALIFDMDNDGWKDIFVANGIYKDLLDQDYINFYSDPSIVRNLIRTQEHAILTLIKDMPSVRIPNYAFRNNKDLTFSNLAQDWGLGKPSFSNGAAYGDIDNDGDLDLVINNVNMPPFVYKNMASETRHFSFFGIRLKGDKQNLIAIGSKVTVYSDGKMFYQELAPMRGFESTSDSRLLFGLGDFKKIDSVLIEWPDDRYTKIFNSKIDQWIEVDIRDANADKIFNTSKQGMQILKDVTGENILSYKHEENDFSDFNISPMMFQMISNEGPKIACGDINNDGRDDLVIGGARDQPASVFVQGVSGKFLRVVTKTFDMDKISEDTDCLLFDADNDKDLDLYITSGGYEYPSSSSALISRLYFNDGFGNFVKSKQLLPSSRFESSSCVTSGDFDHDGDIDLATGIRVKPFSYGLPVNAYILQNDGKGNFTDVSGEIAPGLREIGMITDMTWADIDGDKDDDLLIVGEYMPITVFRNNKGRFVNDTEKCGLINTSGWWRTIEKNDIDNDGDIDFIIGNNGLNSRFKASVEKPVTLYISDFDRNGSLDQILCRYNGDKSYPIALQDQMVQQIPFLKKKYPDHNSYKDQTIDMIFSKDQLKNAIVKTVVDMNTSIMINKGDGTFIIKALPVEAQLSPVYAIHVTDLDDDGNKDLLLGGNLYKVKPEVGIYDGSYGVVLKGNGNGEFETMPYEKSGFFVKGQIRDIKEVTSGKGSLILVAVNNGELRIFKKR